MPYFRFYTIAMKNPVYDYYEESLVYDCYEESCASNGVWWFVRKHAQYSKFFIQGETFSQNYSAPNIVLLVVLWAWKGILRSPYQIPYVDGIFPRDFQISRRAFLAGKYINWFFFSSLCEGFLDFQINFEWREIFLGIFFSKGFKTSRRAFLGRDFLYRISTFFVCFCYFCEGIFEVFIFLEGGLFIFGSFFCKFYFCRGALRKNQNNINL